MNTKRFMVRGKRKDNGDWIEGLLCNWLLDMGSNYVVSATIKINPVTSYEIDPETMGRCTCMEDSKGKTVWEGDIITRRYNDTEAVTSVIIDKGWGWSRRNTMGGEYLILERDYKDSTVIGNRYDNPELFEKEEQQ